MNTSTRPALMDAPARITNDGGAVIPPMFNTAQEMLTILGKIGHVPPCLVIISDAEVLIIGENYRLATPGLGPVLGQPLVASPASYAPPVPNNTPATTDSLSTTPTLVSDYTSASLDVALPTTPPMWPALLGSPPRMSPLTMAPPLLPPVLPGYRFTFQYPSPPHTQDMIVSRPRADTPFPTHQHPNDLLPPAEFSTDTIKAVNNIVEAALAEAIAHEDDTDSDSGWSDRSLTPYTASEIARSWEDAEPIPNLIPPTPVSTTSAIAGLTINTDVSATWTPVPPLPSPLPGTIDSNAWAHDHRDGWTQGRVSQPSGPVRHTRIPRRINPYPPHIKVVSFTPNCGLCHQSGHDAITCKYAQRCSICDKIGHISEDCPHRRGRCWHCRQTGHQRHNCPNRSFTRRTFAPVKNKIYFKRRTAAMDALKDTIRFLKNKERGHQSHGSPTQARVYSSLREETIRRYQEIQQVGFTDGFPAM